ncbi:MULTISPECIES: hypothetical protein [unclassified Micromonospora]|uniref:hypothetical protein n=1 Tax=unclassified Micromonospora TaxID=2617518 RepID=UPI001B39673E|nr:MULTISPECIES: hypothetical protein [unclassified Micromonospora]MBQ1046762.1 hypothetical protein [Micromonospora sp. C72]MBQ1058729.1 hypothetical protein [Micromonospora sp. C32]
MTVRFLRMMSAEQVGDDSLGRTVELARQWWGTADDRLADALRELHGEPAAPTGATDATSGGPDGHGELRGLRGEHPRP